VARVSTEQVDTSAALAARAAAERATQPAFISVLTPDLVRDYAAIAAPDGPLRGIPFAVKDYIDLAGMPTTAANPARTAIAEVSATVIERLLAAGAIPVAKTNLDQYATGLVGTRSPFGACHSVYSAAHISGGSSSGSAVAVASEVMPFALGTDTAGSGRVPAAFNGIVGLKATKGLVSTSGIVPACRSLDCVTVLTSTVSQARTLFDVLAVFDPSDPFARPRRHLASALPRGRRPVIGIPDLDLDLDTVHERAWQVAVTRARELFTIVSFDATPFLEAAQLLYDGPWVAERAVAFGAELHDGPGIDPTVRSIVSAAATISAEDTFRGMYRLAKLRRDANPTWACVDAILIPVTPTHPTLAEVAIEPVAVNSRLGRFTNMTNLLDMAALAVPADLRADGLPFGVQFLGPAHSDELLLDVGALWTGEPGGHEPGPDTRAVDVVKVAVAGAHLSGQPLNVDLVRRGGRLVEATRTAPDYRMYEVPGPIRRPGLTRLLDNASGGGQPLGRGIDVEVWSLPSTELAGFIATIMPPLAIGRLTLVSGEQVLGFLCTADGVDPNRDITHFGGWRAYLHALE
jgi:allophanate hydrolase